MFWSCSISMRHVRVKCWRYRLAVGEREGTWSTSGAQRLSRVSNNAEVVIVKCQADPNLPTDCYDQGPTTPIHALHSAGPLLHDHLKVTFRDVLVASIRTGLVTFYR